MGIAVKVDKIDYKESYSDPLNHLLVYYILIIRFRKIHKL